MTLLRNMKLSKLCKNHSTRIAVKFCIKSVFSGPGFITISKIEDIDWELITEDIANIFDKL